MIITMRKFTLYVLSRWKESTKKCGKHSLIATIAQFSSSIYNTNIIAAIKLKN